MKPKSRWDQRITPPKQGQILSGSPISPRVAATPCHDTQKIRSVKHDITAYSYQCTKIEITMS